MGSYTRATHLFYHCYAGLPKLNETPQGYSETSGVRSGKSHYVYVVSASPSCGRIEYKLLTQLQGEPPSMIPKLTKRDREEHRCANGWAKIKSQTIRIRMTKRSG